MRRVQEKEENWFISFIHLCFIEPFIQIYFVCIHQQPSPTFSIINSPQEIEWLVIYTIPSDWYKIIMETFWEKNMIFMETQHLTTQHLLWKFFEKKIWFLCWVLQSSLSIFWDVKAFADLQSIDNVFKLSIYFNIKNKIVLLSHE